MTKAKKVLFITQEITPYVPESSMSFVGRNLPQLIQENGNEIRTFMPRWGIINERRNQLHEVIRLSGMNIVIDDTDHPLIIKVASIQAARMQVYFIDNDDYFHKRAMLSDENGNEYADNIERAIFYARGVLETVKKLRWVPDVIHCQGWVSAIAPLLIKTAFADDTPFVNTKVVFDAYEEMPRMAPPANIKECLEFRNVNTELLDGTGIDFTQPDALGKLAVHFSDGIVLEHSDAQSALAVYAKERGIIVTTREKEAPLADAYEATYSALVGE
ncbi:MAG: glycogen/starch synthase [Bacteroidaceae bacterium]|nr:glycogen/starch synthase [Bacteroidaceae bacterium]